MQNERVVKAEFSEKAFEIAYDVELASSLGGDRLLFPPSQVLEKIVGFDAAANPGIEHLVWKVLLAPRPAGVVLLPTHWAGMQQPASTDLPRNPTSLILQFKRPEYMYGGRASQRAMWKGSYYRFARDADQQKVLKRLEANLRDQAIVRYAAPAFHTQNELDVCKLASSVIEHSGHVRPGLLVGHKVWTYQRPGEAGKPNPSGKARPFETLAELFPETESSGDDPEPSLAIMPSDGIANHLHALGSAALMREPILRASIGQWKSGLLALDVPFTLVEKLGDFAAVQSLLDRVGAGWWIVGPGS
jgi:hypothetical protein